jgi:hypothetical protein
MHKNTNILRITTRTMTMQRNITQQNNIKCDTWHNNTQHDNTKSNTQHNPLKRDNQYNDTQNDHKNVTLSIKIQNVTPRKITCSITLHKRNSQHNN